MTRISLLITVISAGMINSAAGEEYLLRLEDTVFKDADLQSVKDLHADVPRTDGKKLQGEIGQLAEIQVRPGSPFYSKSVIGKATVTVRGELKPGDNPGQFRLSFKRVRIDATGRRLQAGEGRFVDEAQSTTTAFNELQIEAGKTIVLLGRPDDKNSRNFLATTVRLELVNPGD